MRRGRWWHPSRRLLTAVLPYSLGLILGGGWRGMIAVAQKPNFGWNGTPAPPPMNRTRA